MEQETLLMGGNSSQQKNITPQTGSSFNPFMPQAQPQSSPVQIQTPPPNLINEIEAAFYGGGQGGAASPTPTPTAKPWWAGLLGQ